MKRQGQIDLEKKDQILTTLAQHLESKIINKKGLKGMDERGMLDACKSLGFGSSLSIDEMIEVNGGLVEVDSVSDKFDAYMIFYNDKAQHNTITAGKSHCIESFIEYAPFGDWKTAKQYGHKCLKVSIDVSKLN